MDSWWEALTTVQKLFWGIAVFSTVFFAIQTVLVFIGLDGGGDSDFATDTDVDVDTSHDTDADFEDSTTPIARFFTIRNMVAFMVGFSWSGLGFVDMGYSTLVSTGLSTLVGTGFVAIIMFMMDMLAKLKSDGTIALKNAIGETASVTIQVPGNMQGHGKVGVTLQERFLELEAITKGETLNRDQHVKVVGVSGNQLIVQEITQD